MGLEVYNDEKNKLYGARVSTYRLRNDYTAHVDPDTDLDEAKG